MNNFDRFVLFHAENPHVYDLFERLALKGIAAGRRHLSAYQIFEVMRWEYSIETIHHSSEFYIYSIYTEFNASIGKLRKKIKTPFES